MNEGYYQPELFDDKGDLRANLMREIDENYKNYLYNDDNDVDND